MITLLLVDVQRDFHPPHGSLAIPKADEDAQRIATFIQNHPTQIERIVCTMDSHQVLHIAHPGFWMHSTTKDPPPPFTLISHEDIRKGIWKPREAGIVLPTDPRVALDPTIFGDISEMTTQDGLLDVTKYALEYTKRLESKKNAFQLCIWPEHCLIGSPGHALVTSVHDSIRQWSLTTGRTVEWMPKGESLLTESYSAMEAEIPINQSTSFCQTIQDSFLQSLSSTTNNSSSLLVVAGQAASHCVNHTVRSIVERWPKKEEQPAPSLSQLVLLKDCMSPVTGFEASAEQFYSDMKELGVVLATSTDQLFATTTTP